MKALRGLLKFIGYSAFFLVALVFFVYLTLPLGEVEDYLVRKAADEYNADLTFNDDDSLDTCGLTCVEAKNVTVNFRASPEEKAQFEAKRKVYLDWRKAQQAAAEGKTGGGGSAGAPAKAAGKDADDDDKGDGKGDDKKTAAADASDAPERPENPAKTIELDRLKLAAAPFKLLRGTIDGTLEAELIGGSIAAAVAQGDEEITLKATISDLDASKLDVLQQIIELPIVGTLSSELDLTVPIEEDAKGKRAPDLTGLGGTVGLTIAGVAVGPGQIKTKSKTGFPFFDVPKTRIDRLGGQIVFARKRATFENFKIVGKDLEGELTGYGTLMPKLKNWRLNAHLNLKFSETFLSDHRDVKVALSSSPYLRRGQADGYTGFNIHGTVGNVKFRPRKKSVGKSRGRAAKSRAAKKRSGRKTSALDRKGRTTTKRSGARAKPSRAKRSPSKAAIASPTVRKGRTSPTADEPEPEDDEPEDDEADEEPEGDEPEDTEGDEKGDDEKGDDEKGDDEKGDDEKGDDEEDGEQEDKPEDEEKEE